MSASPAEAARGADLVLLNLPTTDAVNAAVFGEAGVASVLQPPQLLIDFSTVKVEQGRVFAVQLRERTGCGWIDAPVSGGPPAVASGTLTVMAGGDADSSLLQKVYPRMVKRDFAPQGYARQMLKDLEMLNELAGGMKVPLPMTGVAQQLYRMLVHLGHAELDSTALVKLYERDAAH